MKKILCAVLALAAMTSCSKEYTISENKQAIAFGEAFVDNGTRADYSQLNKPVEAFKVYGTLTGSSTTGGNTVQIFNGANVTKPADYYNSSTGVYNNSKAWICNETQYWVPGASYQFAAIVDGVADTTTTLPATIPFTVEDGANNKDLLYATATASVGDDGTVTDLTNNLVAFTFDHLLSKLQFTITNQMQGNYNIQVTSITVTGVAEEGTYIVAGGTWDDVTGTTQLTFGTTGVIASANNAVASETRQILPVNQTLAVTIAYDIYYGSTKISATTKSGTIPAQVYAKETVYNITAAISANQIQFTVNSVDGWNTPVVNAPLQN